MDTRDDEFDLVLAIIGCDEGRNDDKVICINMVPEPKGSDDPGYWR